MGLFRRRSEPRPPVADLDDGVVEVGGHQLRLAEAEVAARVQDHGLQVMAYHPLMADLPEELRLPAAVELLVATLGEVGLRQSVGELLPASHPPIDAFGLPALRAFVQSLGIEVQPPVG